MKRQTKSQLVLTYLTLHALVSVGVFCVLHFFLLKQYVLLEVLVALNLSSLVMFGYDKMVSGYERSTRLPENFFFLIATFGGSFGILIGSNLFKHKRQKLSFMVWIFAIILMQLAVIFALYYFNAPVTILFS